MEFQLFPSARNLGQHGLSSTSDQPGFSRRYACDRCRGHKLRCNRDAMSSMTTPCRRCSKAKAKCTISSNFRPGRPSDDGGTVVGQERAMRAQGRTPTAETRKSQSSTGSLALAQEEIAQYSENGATAQAQPGLLTSKSCQSRSHSTPSPQHDFRDTSNNGQGGDRGLDQSDSLQLDTVPWMDVMDMSFAGHELQLSGGTAEGPSGSGGILHTSYTSNPDCNSNTGLPSYIFPSPTNNYDFGQSAAGADERASSAVHNTELRERSPPAEARISRNFSNGNFEALGNSMLSGFNSTSTSSASPLSPHVALQSHTASHNNSPGNPIDQKEACIQKLSELSASLMKDLNRLITCKLASSFLFTPSDKNTAGYLFKTVDRTTSQDNAIGRMLQGTEQFLEVLQEFKLPPLAPSPPSPPSPPFMAHGSDGGDGDGFPGVDDVTGYLSDGSKEGRMEMRWNVLQSYFDRSNPPVPTPPQSTSDTSSLYSSGQSFKLDVPSTLVILNCYTCLLKIFETVVYAVYHSLECAPSSTLDAKLPPTVSGLQIDGFMLNNYRSLQIKILIQISTHMLDSLEKALGFGAGDQDGSGVVLGDPVFQALLQTLLKQEGLDYSEENKSGMKKVRDMLKKVEALLK